MDTPSTLTWNIFCSQSRFSAINGTMTEDFVFRCIKKGITKVDTVFYLGEYYRQCEQVCEETYERVKNNLHNYKLPVY